MFKRILFIFAILGAVFVLAPFPLMAQSKSDGDRLLHEARQFQKAGSREDLKRAEQKYKDALAIFRKIGASRSEWQALNTLGKLHRDSGQYSEAVQCFEEALQTARKIGEMKLEGNTLNNLGRVYASGGPYSKAVEYYERALKINRTLGDAEGEGHTLNDLGDVYKDAGQFPKAREYYEKSLEIFRRADDERGEARTLCSLGMLYSDVGQYSKAVECCELCLKIKKKVGDQSGGGLITLGMVYSAWGQYARAVASYEEAVERFRSVRNVRDEGRALNNLGVLSGGWGQYSKAVDYYEKALELARSVGDVRAEGLTVDNLGRVYAHAGEYEKALVSFRRGLAIWGAIGVHVRWPKKLIGDVYLDMGDLGKAEPFLKGAGYSSSLGRLYLTKLDYQTARKCYEKLLTGAEKSRNANDLFTAYTGLGMVFEGMGDDSKAGEHYLKAVQLTEELRAGLSRTEKERFFDVRVEGFYRTAPYKGLSRVLMRMNKPAEAFKRSEYTKARVFAEVFSRGSEGTRFDVPEEVLKKDAELSDQIAALKKSRQKAYEKEDEEVITALEPQINDLEDRLAAHIRMLREKYPLFSGTKYPQPMGLDQVTLKDNEWVLAYDVTESGFLVYLTRGREIVKTAFKPVQREELNALVLRFRKPLEIVCAAEVEEKLRSFDLAAGKKLSELLLSDVLDHLPAHVQVIIIPDDSLGILTFEMLVLNQGGIIKTDKDVPYVSGAEFFGDRNRISYSQSVTALALARIHAKARVTQPRLLVVADPVFQENDYRAINTPKKEPPTGVLTSLFKRLNLMDAEGDGQTGGVRFSRLALTADLARALVEIHESASDVYTGLAASKDRFLAKIGPSLNRYDKVVFATHGYLAKDLPGIMEPVLVLTLVPPGTDGFLRMTEVMGLNMNADIVALTACRTGLGKRVSGEGTLGMGRAFEYAGARSVLMSLWTVSEEASVNLVKSFFRHMKEGVSKVEALSLARTEIRSNGFDHPFFWAGFILVGEGN